MSAVISHKAAVSLSQHILIFTHQANIVLLEAAGFICSQYKNFIFRMKSMVIGSPSATNAICFFYFFWRTMKIPKAIHVAYSSSPGSKICASEWMPKEDVPFLMVPAKKENRAVALNASLFWLFQGKTARKMLMELQILVKHMIVREESTTGAGTRGSCRDPTGDEVLCLFCLFTSFPMQDAELSVFWIWEDTGSQTDQNSLIFARYRITYSFSMFIVITQKYFSVWQCAVQFVWEERSVIKACKVGNNIDM